jgi:hypothetical protein
MEATNKAVNRVMNSSNSVGLFFKGLFVIFGLVGLYYLYQYLFGPRTANSYTLVPGKLTANIDPSKPIVVTYDKLPPLFEGGEFTISTWLYVNNWSYRAGFAKSIINIGGPNFDTIRMYLGGYKPKLHIRFHTQESGATSNIAGESLSRTTDNYIFNALQPESNLSDDRDICDLPEIDLQRWVNVTVAVNGKTIDVYLNGKLARSCVLPQLFKVDSGGYSANILSYGGFGGQISNIVMYDTALNPEQVYKNYMSGPEPITNIGQWIVSFFEPRV